ncbi:hypothetical protein POM88_023010 [Heracleum sosnowskyi]|uniref:Reverse transcriptase domain-containing protein n=1 Tax=Heracleum sosnowskyi TaxID=360622 RepID=A0AAD8MQ43_9APIA|nr:hypothetical protein POM88_023010 [Heracleum sosnowskyi]
MGDFNSVREESDRINCLHSDSDSEVFNDFINNNGMIHIKIQSPHYTWFGPKSKRSTLDWIFINKAWMGDYTWNARLLNRKNSDHGAIWFGTTKINWGPKPFKLYNSWLDEQTLSEMISNLSNNIDPININLRQAIKEIRTVGKWWNKNVLGNLDETITIKEEEMQKIDNGTIPMNTTTRMELQNLYHHRDHMIWKKSRALWHAGGDKNMKYFHQVVNRKRQRNIIFDLMQNNHWIDDPTQVKSILYDHFKNFLNRNHDIHTFRIDTLEINTISNSLKNSLECNFNEEEISIALKESDSNKAPGPDGLNAGCLKCCWSFIKPGFIKMIKTFHQTGQILHHMILKAKELGKFEGIQIGQGSISFTHLQFANDTLLFINGDDKSISSIKRILLTFQLLSGLKINFHKSELFAVNYHSQQQVEWATTLSCKIGMWPIKYLGVPPGISQSNIKLWEPLIKRFQNNLNDWASNHLNMASKLVLMKATLDSLPIYWFNFFKMPAGVRKKNSIRNSFLWGSEDAFN